MNIQTSPTPSFWEADLWPRAPDLLVVGAGIVGSTAARLYKERNPSHTVLLIDRASQPLGASTRNAGFACIGSIGEHLADGARTDPETVFSRIERRWNGLQKLLSSVPPDVVGYEACGGVEIFTDDEPFEEARSEISRFNSELHRRIGEEAVYREREVNGYPAIENRLEGALHSGRLMETLLGLAAEAGVQIRWNCELTSLNNGTAVLSTGETLSPKQTLLAVNAWAPQFIDLPVQPARGQVFITKPIPQLHWRGTFHYHQGYVYFRNVGDRLLLGGARHVDQKGETTNAFGIHSGISDWLHRFADDVLKLPHGWQTEHHWSGIMGMTPDKNPVIQRKDSLVYAAGLSGMGVAIGSDVAAQAVELLCQPLSSS